MGTITNDGKIVNTIGSLPVIGTQAPYFSLTNTDLSEFTSKNCLGKKTILSIFPSLDTSTCAVAMVRFNRIADIVPKVWVVCISYDLPFAQERFCVAKKVNHVIPVSCFRNPEFGKNYGVTMLDGPYQGLLSRAIVLLNEKGIVMYTEQVADLMSEPNYDALLHALKKSS